MLKQINNGFYVICDKCRKGKLLPFDEAAPRCDRHIQSLEYTQDGKGNQAKHFCPDCVTAPAKRREAALATRQGNKWQRLRRG